MAGKQNPPDIVEAMITTPVAAADWLAVAPVVVTIIGGAICVMIRKNPSIQLKVALAFLSVLVVVNFALLAHVIDKGVVVMVMGRWYAPFGIAFAVDTTGALLSTISAIVALCVGVYGMVDVSAAAQRYGFYPFLLLLMTGVSGSFLTGDIFNLYVWFEVLLIASFGLIVLGNEKIQLDGTLKYGVLNFFATTLFLMATGLLYAMVGTLNMADIAQSVRELEDGAPLMTVTALYGLAFGIKAAAFPVNFWLPASYHTPRIVVSAIFAGLLTKVGVYALVRTFVMLLPEGRGLMAGIVALVAILTMLTGAFGALAQTDVRRTLGYLVISGIGVMLAGLAMGTEDALSGTLFYAVHSIVVMSALYLAVGVIGRCCSTFDIRKLNGLYKESPGFAALFLVLSFGIAGIPPFSGFWPKLILVKSGIESGNYWLSVVVLVSGFLTTIVVGRVWLLAFWRGSSDSAEAGNVRQSPKPLSGSTAGSTTAIWIPLCILFAVVVAIGIVPEPLFNLTDQGAFDLLNPTSYIEMVLGANQ